MSEKQDIPQDQDESSLQEISSKNTQNTESDEKECVSNSPEHAEVCGGFLESPKPFSPFVSQCNSPVEGAVGGELLEAKSSSSSDNAIKELNKHASVLDRRALHSGKLDVFKKYFNEEGMQFFTRPENRKRHKAARHGCLESERTSPDDNPLEHLQIIEPPPEPLLNQAGAVVGVSRSTGFLFESDDNNPLSGFGFVAEAEHSLGSAETAPIGEVYSGNFSPIRPPSDFSDRGVSPGLSFASFSSRPTTSSDCYDLKISPLPGSESPDDAKKISPESTDSESLPAERSVRRKKPAASKQIHAPTRSESALAGSEGSYSDEQKEETDRNISNDTPETKSGDERMAIDSSVSSTNLTSSFPKESDLDVYMTQRPVTDSEDEAALYPELSHSVESDQHLPMPDITRDISGGHQQNLDVLRVSEGISGVSVSGDTQQSPEPVPAEESDSEQDPISVLSCSYDASKHEKRLAPKKDDFDK